jgi:rfaE bifunctional protein kinase chain/domain
MVTRIHSIRPFRALVIGDFMLDSYTTGKVRRISPEAPVPILEVMKQESRPGGAGNVALNFAALGGQVEVVGRLGDDGEGDFLRTFLAKQGVGTQGFFSESGHKTPVKNRLIADSQQLLRVDLETVSPLSLSLEAKVLSFLEKAIPQVGVVAVSDYGKGFLTPKILAEAIAISRRVGVPLIVDPKGTEFGKYRGAKVIKPNLGEAYTAAKLTSSASLEEVAQAILQMTESETLLITRSEAGISLFEQGKKRCDFPVQSREVKDVTGAGDTVLAVVGAALANGVEMQDAIAWANAAASVSIERLGCVQVTLAEISTRLLEWEQR